MKRTLIIERLSAARLPSDAGMWLKAVLLAALAVKTAQLLWAIATPVGPLGAWRAPVPAILSPDAQAMLFATVNPFDRAGTAAAAVPADLPSDLKLFGVRDNIGSIGGGAIIALADGTQLSVAVGEAVMPGVVLVGVGFDYADVERGGARQRLFLDADKPPETLAAGTGAAAGPSGAPAALTPQALRGAVSFSPRQANGAISGILVAPGGDAATFATTGFRSGDVIVAVNGARIASATDLAQLQQSLAPGATLALTVERDGRQLPLTLKLAGS